MNLYIVTDSTADIPKPLMQELNIPIVPLKVHVEGQTYLDGVTLSSNEFYEKLQSSEQLPRTSQPAPLDFVNVYEEIAARDPEAEIISIHLSSALSGTYQTAMLAAGMVEEKVKVHVVDSRSASYALGAIVVAAARLVRNGGTLEECLTLVRTLISEHRVYFVMDTLMYLQKGGRIGKAASIVGSLLNIKPILMFDESGEVAVVEKVRGKKKAVARILELAKEYANERPVTAAAVYTTDRDEAAVLKGQVEQELTVTGEAVLAQLGPVIGTYGGPGLLAITLYPETS
ncbi:DegV family protein [Aneurinibacillus uraniidurans]|uniref:DegV family protein n=1 Tax=Aneurinibacillus uraniidurans TaxID=2966586 RepID=UPI00234BC55F|nr:DegV family protein [Aneurinibacillus sp. B1]WCN39043.1 DegV family protein [Aneurinibacillus sp. B1]